MKVVIIGSGNVATVLGNKIAGAGHEIVQVAGRNAEKVSSLACSLKTACTTNLFDINLLADVYLIAVTDAAIEKIASILKLNNQLVLHTAASVSKEILAICSTQYGILYPLQTFTAGFVTSSSIPLLIDGNNQEVKEKVESLALTLSDDVSFVNDEQRLHYHLAAIFVNNFTNHLFAIANEFCTIKGLNFNILEPLLDETILRVKKQSPATVQTGPARRGDEGTISKHQALLKDNLEMLDLYNCLTMSIRRYYEGKNI